MKDDNIYCGNQGQRQQASYSRKWELSKQVVHINAFSHVVRGEGLTHSGHLQGKTFTVKIEDSLLISHILGRSIAQNK